MPVIKCWRVEGGPNQSSSTYITKTGFSFIKCSSFALATHISPSDKGTTADSVFVSAAEQQDSFWSCAWNHNKLFAYVCTRSQIVPRTLGRAFTETEGTQSFQMFPIQCLISAVIQHWTKISSGKHGYGVFLYPNENSHLSVTPNTLLLLSSGKASAAWENPLLLCFIQLLPGAAVPKALCPRLMALWSKRASSALQTYSHLTGVEGRKKRRWQLPVKYKP